MLQFSLSSAAEKQVNIIINQLVIAGWAGRDSQAVLAHIRELEALGCPHRVQCRSFIVPARRC